VNPGPLDNDLDPSNPVDLTTEEWAEFYQELGPDYEDYMDHDHSMDY
jgi:hypothetical protein